MADEATGGTQRPKGARTANKAATTAKSKATSRQTVNGASAAEVAEVAEERRKLASVEATLARERENLARIEEELERERRRADAAEASLGAQQGRGATTPAHEQRPSSPASAGERAEQKQRAQSARDDADALLWPYFPGMENLAGADLFAAGQRMALAAWRNPGLGLQESSEFMDEMTR